MSQAASLFVIFGATGDLAERMLLPSLYCLHRDGLLPPHLVVLGTSRSEMDDAAFSKHVQASAGRIEAALQQAASNNNNNNNK